MFSSKMHKIDPNTDLYEVLNIPYYASPDLIRQAYARVTQEKSKNVLLVLLAYQTLLNPTKRYAYDMKLFGSSFYNPNQIPNPFENIRKGIPNFHVPQTFLSTNFVESVNTITAPVRALPSPRNLKEVQDAVVNKNFPRKDILMQSIQNDYESKSETSQSNPAINKYISVKSFGSMKYIEKNLSKRNAMKRTSAQKAIIAKAVTKYKEGYISEKRSSSKVTKRRKTPVALRNASSSFRFHKQGKYQL